MHELLVEPGTRMAVGTVMATLLEPGGGAGGERTRTKTVRRLQRQQLPVVRNARSDPRGRLARAGRALARRPPRKRAEALQGAAGCSGSVRTAGSRWRTWSVPLAAARPPVSPPAVTLLESPLPSARPRPAALIAAAMSCRRRDPHYYLSNRADGAAQDWPRPRQHLGRPDHRAPADGGAAAEGRCLGAAQVPQFQLALPRRPVRRRAHPSSASPSRCARAA